MSDASSDASLPDFTVLHDQESLCRGDAGQGCPKKAVLFAEYEHQAVRVFRRLCMDHAIALAQAQGGGKVNTAIFRKAPDVL